MENKQYGQYGETDEPATILPNKDKRTWNETLLLLKTTHTISIRDICQQLKCSRSWVAKYIIPHIDKLYLDTGYRGDKVSTISWTRIAAIMLNDEKYLNNSLWCHEEQYDCLIRMHTTSITKQTKRIPIELLVKDKQQFAKQYNLIIKKIKQKEEELYYNRYNTKIIQEIGANRKLLKIIEEEHLSDIGKVILDTGKTTITKRSSTVPVDVLLPETPISEWRALHDDKDYGDTDESVLREYFREGYIRVEIHLPATIEDIQIQQKDIKYSKKIYYISDPAPIRHYYVNKYITISEKVWQQWEKKLLP